MLRTLFLVAVLFTLVAPKSAPAADCRPAPHGSKKTGEARAKAKLEGIKPLINAGKYKTARLRLENSSAITPAPWPPYKPISFSARLRIDRAFKYATFVPRTLANGSNVVGWGQLRSGEKA
jgi:hypothetical protein